MSQPDQQIFQIFKIIEKEVLQKQTNILQSLALKSKEKLLNTDFNLLSDFEAKEARISHIKQFAKLLTGVILFPDEEIHSRLNELHVRPPITQWFTPLDEILNELYQLLDVPNAHYYVSSYLVGAYFYIDTKVKSELLDSFGFSESYANLENSNFIHQYFYNQYRREGYTGTTSISDIDQTWLNEIQALELKHEIQLKKILLDGTRGKIPMVVDIFSDFYAPALSQNKAYALLFPFLKLVLKDRELFSQEEFDNQPALMYGGSYKRYKGFRVKKILTKN